MTAPDRIKYRVERALEIAAPPAAVWDQITAVRTWPEWKPFIARTVLEEDRLSLGSRFKMHIRVKGSFAAPVSVRVCDWQPLRRIAWTGGIPGVSMSVHSFMLEAKDGRTLLTSREEFSGALVWLMLRLVTPADLESLHDRWLLAIKNRVERPPVP